MKKILFLILVLIMAGSARADEIYTPQMTAVLISAVEANDTALDVNTASWAYAKSWTQIPATWSTLKVMFYATEPNDPNGESLTTDGETFSFKFYIADYGNNGQVVADCNATVGAMLLSHNPITLAELASGSGDPNTNWVDTISTPVEAWNGTVAAQNNAGEDGAASLVIGRESGKTAKCIITNRSSGYLHVNCIAYGY